MHNPSIRHIKSVHCMRENERLHSYVPCSIAYPSARTSCDRMTAVTWFASHHRRVTSGPNPTPTPYTRGYHHDQQTSLSAEILRMLTRFEGPRPGASCGSVQSSYQARPQHQAFPTDHTPQRLTSHINPSCPGCFPYRLIFLTSSSVTPSLLKRPPCTTKYRFLPSGLRMAGWLPSDLRLDGNWEAVRRVAMGTAASKVGVKVLCRYTPRHPGTHVQ